MTMEKKTTTRAGMDAAMTWPDARCLDDRTPRSAAEKLDVESSPESSTVTELASSLRSLDLLHDELLRANGDGHVASVLPMLVRYESDVLRLRQCLNVVRFDGRDHLLRDIQRNDERFRSPTVQHIVAGWIGTPGVEERWNSIRQQWSEIRELLMPLSKEAAVRQLVHDASPDRQADPSLYVATYPRQRTPSWAECWTPERFPGVLNLNMAQAGTDVQTHQRTSQDVQQELRLTQALEIAYSQEQRFKTLLKDLNSSGAELHTTVEQAQDARQDIVDASQTSKQILTELAAQNDAALRMTDSLHRERGLTRSLLIACTSLALCLGLPKLTCLLPLLKRVPVIQPHAVSMEKSLRRSDGVAVASNLVRERHAYKMSYEALQEMADIQKSGNFLHKIAFGILGLGHFLQKRLAALPPPSDTMEEDERWVDQRATPYGPPQWTKKST